MERDALKGINKREPLVSIIIDNYNYDAFLRKAIDSALAQEYANTEVIVVDDGSTDRSRDIIESYGTEIIMILKKNCGQASAFNAGFASSRGEIVCFLDSDDYFAPHKVDRVVELLELYSMAGWVFHEVQYVDKKGALSANRNPRLLSETLWIDERPNIVNGRRIREFRSPTSGLCLRRNVLSQTFPIPDKLFFTADQFVLLTALYLSPGLKTNERLAFQRLHDKNIWTFRHGVDQLKSEIRLITAYYLRERFPDTLLYANRSFSFALGSLIAAGGLSRARKCKECRDYLNRYFSFKDWIKYGPRIGYHFVHSRWNTLLARRVIRLHE